MRQMRTTGETALYPKLIKLPIIEGSKFRRQSAKSADQPELTGSDVNDKPEPRFLRKRERILGFALHINERVPCREKIRGQVPAAVGRAIEVAHLVRRLQRAVQKITPSPDMSRPRQDETSEAHIGPGLEALQSVPFDQVIAELAEAVCRLIVAQARSADHTNPNVGKARAVALATREAETYRPPDDHGN